MAQIFKKKILIDLDGVLNEYKGQYYADTIPEIKAGVVNFYGFSDTFEICFCYS